MNQIYKKVDNISSLSTQIQVLNDINYSNTKKENQTIHIKKELIKYIEHGVKMRNQFFRKFKCIAWNNQKRNWNDGNSWKISLSFFDRNTKVLSGNFERFKKKIKIKI